MGPGAKWAALWGKMVCALELNVLGPGAKSMGPGAKWAVPLGKKCCALRLNGLSPGAKWGIPWG